MNGPTVFFDIETAGVKRRKHPIIQLAAIAVGPDWEEIGAFEAKLTFDEGSADPEALTVNSYDRALWESFAVSPRTAMQAWCDWLRPYRCLQRVSKAGRPYTVARLAGHNARDFDCPRVMDLCSDLGLFLPADAYRPLDTLALATWCFHHDAEYPSSYKLGDVCAFFGIEGGTHDAMTDVRATVACARALVEFAGASGLW